MIEILSSFLLFGQFCFNDLSGDIDQCKQIHVNGLISRADCQFKFQSIKTRVEQEIEEKGYVLTSIEARCFETTGKVDSNPKKVYSIL